MADVVIELKNVNWKYPSFSGKESNFQMKNINLQIYKNEFFGITGSTGSGKSTLCQLISGIIPHQIKVPDGKIENYFSGEVIVLGKTISKIEKGENGYVLVGEKNAAPDLGLVMQDPESQFLTMSALTEITLGMRIMGLSKEEMENRIKESLELVGLGDLYPVLDKLHPSELSGGQKQRLILASFLAMRPKILILDEPTSDLDSLGKMEIIEAIKNVKEKGDITVILVEHDPEILMKFTDRLAVLYNGEIVMLDTPEKIFSDEMSRKYIEVPEIERMVDDEEFLKKVDLEIARGFKLERGKSVKGENIIEVKDLVYDYPDGTRALNGINIVVGKGEMIALVGQNGSGKSTFSKIISGYLTKWKGSVKILGMDLSDKKVREKIPEYVGYVFQNPVHQIFNRTVRDEIAYGLKNIGEKNIEPIIDETLKRVGLLSKKFEDPLFLSRGEKRRLAVASVIAMRPKILIVDEPTTGQDYKMSREIMDLLFELNMDGTTIIVITHDMRLVAEYCRRTVVMKRGKIIFDGSPEELFLRDDILKESSLLPPKAVRLSKKLRDSGVINDLLLSAREWLEFLKFESEKKKYVFLSFQSMKYYAKKLADEILKTRGRPDLLVYIERGGMVIGRLLSDYLNVKDVQSIKASYYLEDGTPSTHVKLGEFTGNLKNVSNYVLLVDDIADTGKTLEAVLNKLRDQTDKPIVVCTIAYKPHSIIKPDYYAYIVDKETWVVFEYEEEETKRAFIKRDNKLGLKFIEESFGK